MTMITAIILSKVDYCNLLALQGLPKRDLDRLQSVINAAARLKPIPQLQLDCDTTTIRLRRKTDVHFLLASNGSRRARYVVVGS